MKKILVGTDTSARAEHAVEAAADLARAYHAELVVLYARPPLDAREVIDPDKAPDPARYLERLRERLADVEVRTRAHPGDPAETITEVAEQEAADVIVVGNRGVHGRSRRLPGSVAIAVVRRAATSVLVVDTREAG